MLNLKSKFFLFPVIFVCGLLLGVEISRQYNVDLHTYFLPLNLRNTIQNDPYGHAGEAIVANYLAKRIRIACLILTMPKNHLTKAQAVNDTWARRCNTYVFVSSATSPNLPVLVAVAKEGRNMLWYKVKNAITHAAEKLANDYDYFLKADDDTYVIVENLRKLLMNMSPEDPFIMGRRFRPYVKQGYLSGGGGYVMSRAALRRIADGLNRTPECVGTKNIEAEDVHVGQCAEAVGVRLLDSLDENGLERFHPLPPGYMMNETILKRSSWFHKYNYHKVHTGLECCSDYAVSFHYISPEEMRVYEYFLYHLHPYGIHRDYVDLLRFASVNASLLNILN